jgi:signal transduction histidine kinase
VREIIVGHGGRCWVEDAAGRGARFVVEAPLNSSAGSPASEASA